MTETITVTQASERYGVPKQTLYSAVRERRLRHERLGASIWLRPEDVEEFARQWEPKEAANEA